MKLFVCSDIHGHYYEMIDGLRKVGYDDENNEHLLIVMGDLFDRGKYSKEIYHYLKDLCDRKKAIVLRGNHEKFLIDWLKGSDDPFNFVRNGMSYTVDSFLSDEHSFDNYCIDNECDYTPSSFAKYSEISRKYILENEPELLEWLENLPYYYETEHYIFTHASIDTKANDWRHPHCEYYGHLDWDACVWDNGSFFGSTICNTDKTIVIGHFDTGLLRKKYGLGSKDDHSILQRKDGRVIAIDGCVALTKEVNVATIYGEKINYE